MTTLFAAALLAASLAADPAKAAAKPAPASAAALKDATAALLGPCTPQMATAKVTAVEVLDDAQLNARLEKEKSARAKAEPGQRFIAVGYAAGDQKGSSVRQVSTHHMLTTEQAQVLVGQKLCVFKE